MLTGTLNWHHSIPCGEGGHRWMPPWYVHSPQPHRTELMYLDLAGRYALRERSWFCPDYRLLYQRTINVISWGMREHGPQDTSSFSRVSSWWTKVDFACRIRICFIFLLDTSVSWGRRYSNIIGKQVTVAYIDSVCPVDKILVPDPHKALRVGSPLFPLEIGDAMGLQRASLADPLVKNLPAMQKTRVWSLGGEDPLEKKWQPTPILLPGKSHGQRSLKSYTP